MAVFELEMDEECTTCPMLSLTTEKMCYESFDTTVIETFSTHKCEHEDFCKAIRKNWEKWQKIKEN